MANEKRLVNAEAIARKLKNSHCAECNVVRKVQCSACWVEDVLELLEGDTVDAVEVVHGRWCKDGDWLVCLNCESEINVKNILGVENRKNYCPNCGAKMDGDGDG